MIDAQQWKKLTKCINTNQLNYDATCLLNEQKKQIEDELAEFNHIIRHFEHEGKIEQGYQEVSNNNEMLDKIQQQCCIKFYYLVIGKVLKMRINHLLDQDFLDDLNDNSSNQQLFMKQFMFMDIGGKLVTLLNHQINSVSFSNQMDRVILFDLTQMVMQHFLGFVKKFQDFLINQIDWIQKYVHNINWLLELNVKHNMAELERIINYVYQYLNLEMVFLFVINQPIEHLLGKIVLHLYTDDCKIKELMQYENIRFKSILDEYYELNPDSIDEVLEVVESKDSEYFKYMKVKLLYYISKYTPEMVEDYVEPELEGDLSFMRSVVGNKLIPVQTLVYKLMKSGEGIHARWVRKIKQVSLQEKAVNKASEQFWIMFISQLRRLPDYGVGLTEEDDYEMCITQFEYFGKNCFYRLEKDNKKDNELQHVFLVFTDFLIHIYNQLAEGQQNSLLTLLGQFIQNSPSVVFAKDKIIELFLVKAVSAVALFHLYLTQLYYQLPHINLQLIMQHLTRLPSLLPHDAHFIYQYFHLLAAHSPQSEYLHIFNQHQTIADLLKLLSPYHSLQNNPFSLLLVHQTNHLHQLIASLPHDVQAIDAFIKFFYTLTTTQPLNLTTYPETFQSLYNHLNRQIALFLLNNPNVNPVSIFVIFNGLINIITLSEYHSLIEIPIFNQDVLSGKVKLEKSIIPVFMELVEFQRPTLTFHIPSFISKFVFFMYETLIPDLHRQFYFLVLEQTLVESMEMRLHYPTHSIIMALRFETNLKIRKIILNCLTAVFSIAGKITQIQSIFLAMSPHISDFAKQADYRDIQNQLQIPESTLQFYTRDQKQQLIDIFNNDNQQYQCISELIDILIYLTQSKYEKQSSFYFNGTNSYLSIEGMLLLYQEFSIVLLFSKPILTYSPQSSFLLDCSILENKRNNCTLMSWKLPTRNLSFDINDQKFSIVLRSDLDNQIIVQQNFEFNAENKQWHLLLINFKSKKQFGFTVYLDGQKQKCLNNINQFQFEQINKIILGCGVKVQQHQQSESMLSDISLIKNLQGSESFIGYDRARFQGQIKYFYLSLKEISNDELQRMISQSDFHTQINNKYPISLQLNQNILDKIYKDDKYQLIFQNQEQDKQQYLITQKFKKDELIEKSALMNLLQRQSTKQYGYVNSSLQQFNNVSYIKNRSLIDLVYQFTSIDSILNIISLQMNRNDSYHDLIISKTLDLIKVLVHNCDDSNYLFNILNDSNVSGLQCLSFLIIQYVKYKGTCSEEVFKCLVGMFQGDPKTPEMRKIQEQYYQQLLLNQEFWMQLKLPMQLQILHSMDLESISRHSESLFYLLSLYQENRSNQVIPIYDLQNESMNFEVEEIKKELIKTLLRVNSAEVQARFCAMAQAYILSESTVLEVVCALNNESASLEHTLQCVLEYSQLYQNLRDQILAEVYVLLYPLKQEKVFEFMDAYVEYGPKTVERMVGLVRVENLHTVLEIVNQRESFPVEWFVQCLASKMSDAMVESLVHYAQFASVLVKFMRFKQGKIIFNYSMVYLLEEYKDAASLILLVVLKTDQVEMLLSVLLHVLINFINKTKAFDDALVLHNIIQILYVLDCLPLDPSQILHKVVESLIDAFSRANILFSSIPEIPVFYFKFDPEDIYTTITQLDKNYAINGGVLRPLLNIIRRTKNTSLLLTLMQLLLKHLKYINDFRVADSYRPIISVSHSHAFLVTQPKEAYLQFHNNQEELEKCMEMMMGPNTSEAKKPELHNLHTIFWDIVFLLLPEFPHPDKLFSFMAENRIFDKMEKKYCKYQWLAKLAPLHEPAIDCSDKQAFVHTLQEINANSRKMSTMKQSESRSRSDVSDAGKDEFFEKLKRIDAQFRDLFDEHEASLEVMKIYSLRSYELVNQLVRGHVELKLKQLREHKFATHRRSVMARVTKVTLDRSFERFVTSMQHLKQFNQFKMRKKWEHCREHLCSQRGFWHFLNQDEYELRQLLNELVLGERQISVDINLTLNRFKMNKYEDALRRRFFLKGDKNWRQKPYLSEIASVVSSPPLPPKSSLESHFDQSSEDDHYIENSSFSQEMIPEPNSPTQASSQASHMSTILSFDCEMVNVKGSYVGKLKLSEKFLSFQTCRLSHEYKLKCVHEVKHKIKNKTWNLIDISEVHSRRYLLQEVAIELFTDKTYFFNLFTGVQQQAILTQLGQCKVRVVNNRRDAFRKGQYTEKWLQGEISTFQYLMLVNTYSGRTYNDLNQYFVFPWVLKDYTSEMLDFKIPDRFFRELSLPIGSQEPQRLRTLLQRYHLRDQSDEDTNMIYGSHYSHSTIVTNYMVRLEPYANIHFQQQSGKFDLPDRLFYSLASTFKSSMESDFKELIPEFFYFTEFLLNKNQLKLGCKQNREEVQDVVLPSWVKTQTPEEFVFMMRQALECSYVSKNIHRWVDLVFGFENSGEAALKAKNLFHFMSYEANVEKILRCNLNPLEVKARLAQITFYGQTPYQLFPKAHPGREKYLKTLYEQPTFGQDTIVKLAHLDSSILKILNCPSHGVYLIFTDFTLTFIPLATFFSEYRANASSLSASKGSSSLFDLGNLSTSKAVNAHSLFCFIKPNAYSIQGYCQHRFSFTRSDSAQNYKHLFLAVGGYPDNSFRIFQLSGKVVKQHVSMRYHKNIVSTVDYLDSKWLLVVGSADCRITGWYFNPGKGMQRQPVFTIQSHFDEVCIARVNSTLNVIVSVDKEGVLLTHTLNKGEYLNFSKLDLGRDEVAQRIELHENGLIVVLTSSSRVLVYNINGSKYLEYPLMEESSEAVTDIAFTSPLYGQLLTATNHGKLFLIDLFKLKHHLQQKESNPFADLPTMHFKQVLPLANLDFQLGTDDRLTYLQTFRLQPMQRQFLSSSLNAFAINYEIENQECINHILLLGYHNGELILVQNRKQVPKIICKELSNLGFTSK